MCNCSHSVVVCMIMQIMEVFYVYVCCKFVCCFGAELLGMTSALAVHPRNHSID